MGDGDPAYRRGRRANRAGVRVAETEEQSDVEQITRDLVERYGAELASARPRTPPAWISRSPMASRIAREERRKDWG